MPREPRVLGAARDWADRFAVLPAWLRPVVDGLVAFFVLSTSLGPDRLYIFDPVEGTPFDIPVFPAWMPPAHFAWVMAAGAVLTFRRVLPRPAAVALPALLAVHLLLFPTTYSAFVVSAFTMFHLGLHAPPRWRAPAWAAAIAGVTVAMVFRGEAVVVNAGVAMILTPFVLCLLGFFWLLGANRRRRAAEIAALRDRAELAAIAERTRIAREMHDIVAHSLTAVIAQADGGRFIAAKHPDKAVEALENIAGTARSSLAQMRELLSVLRDPADSLADAGATAPATDAASRGAGAGDGAGGSGGDDASGAVGAEAANRAAHGAGAVAGGRGGGAGGPAEYAPMPGLDALPQLIGEAGRSGLEVTFDEEGERPTGRDAVGATAQLTIYRIVQESLTNALKHAGRVPVRVRLAWGRRGVVVEVCNELPGAGALLGEPGDGVAGASESKGRKRRRGPRPGAGRGITGMRERVALHGGTLDIDDGDDGYTVTAWLPLK